jgi:hypothetical protein
MSFVRVKRRLQKQESGSTGCWRCIRGTAGITSRTSLRCATGITGKAFLFVLFHVQPVQHAMRPRREHDSHQKDEYESAE